MRRGRRGAGIAAALSAALLATACGHYGPPVRASGQASPQGATPAVSAAPAAAPADGTCPDEETKP